MIDCGAGEHAIAITLLVVAVADVVISWKCWIPLAPEEWVLAAAIPALPMATVAAAAMIVAVMVLRMAWFPPRYIRPAGRHGCGGPASE